MYPIIDEKDPLQGQVVIRITTSETGEVESTEVMNGDPLLAAAAVNALKQWKFKPFIRNGKPVKASMNIPFSFVFRETADEPSATVSGGTGKNLSWLRLTESRGPFYWRRSSAKRGRCSIFM